MAQPSTQSRFVEVTVVDHSREPNLRVPPMNPALPSKRLLNLDQVVTIQPEPRPERSPIKTIIWLINDSIFGVTESYDSFKGM
jgi:hypothetical protein